MGFFLIFGQFLPLSKAFLWALFVYYSFCSCSLRVWKMFQIEQRMFAIKNYCNSIKNSWLFFLFKGRMKTFSKILFFEECIWHLPYRPHTIAKNVRNIRSVSRTKLPFKRIFSLWTHDQQQLPFLQIFIGFANQNLAVLCMKRPRNGFCFSWNILMMTIDIIQQIADALEKVCN